MPNSEELAGKGRKVVGEVKETIGRAVGNRDLEEQGAAEKTAGGFQAGVGKVARKINEFVDDAVDDRKKP